MLGDADRQEEANIQQEESISNSMYKKLSDLDKEVKELRREFKHLLKIGKKLRKIIKLKEATNKAELAQEQSMQQHLMQKSVKTIKHTADKIKREEQEESKLSKEEALILQAMLNELHDTYKHGEAIIAADKELYLMIKQLYDTDLEDYQLEISDINKQ